MKQGYLAQNHAEVAAKNLKLLMAEGKASKMAIYKPNSSRIAIVSLGRRDAVAQFPLITISGLIPGMIKSRDLFVGKTRKQRGLDPDDAWIIDEWIVQYCELLASLIFFSHAAFDACYIVVIYFDLRLNLSWFLKAVLNLFRV